MSNIPGINAKHAIITPTCRANKGADGAFDEAVGRLREEYAACLDANPDSNFHVVLSVERGNGSAEAAQTDATRQRVGSPGNGTEASDGTRRSGESAATSGNQVPVRSREESHPLDSNPSPVASNSDALKDMEARKDAAYEERNRVVAALAAMALGHGWIAGRARTSIPGWSEDWHGCVYIDLPSGQVSWHYHDSHAHLFEFLPTYMGEWDGHDTPEKYRRVEKLSVAGDGKP